MVMMVMMVITSKFESLRISIMPYKTTDVAPSRTTY